MMSKNVTNKTIKTEFMYSKKAGFSSLLFLSDFNRKVKFECAPSTKPPSFWRCIFYLIFVGVSKFSSPFF